MPVDVPYLGDMEHLSWSYHLLTKPNSQLGRMTTSTVLTLLILPIIYSVIYKFMRKRENSRLLKKIRFNQLIPGVSHTLNLVSVHLQGV
jgi:hypothetical protein